MEEKKDRLAVVAMKRKRYGPKMGKISKEESLKLKMRTEERREMALIRENLWKRFRDEDEDLDEVEEEEKIAWERINNHLEIEQDHENDWTDYKIEPERIRLRLKMSMSKTTDKAEVVKDDSEKAEVTKDEADKPDSDKARLVKDESDKAAVAKDEVVGDKAEVAKDDKPEVTKDEVDKPDSDKDRLVKDESDKAAVAKVEVVSDKAEVAKDEDDKADEAEENNLKTMMPKIHENSKYILHNPNNKNPPFTKIHGGNLVRNMIRKFEVLGPDPVFRFGDDQVIGSPSKRIRMEKTPPISPSSPCQISSTSWSIGSVRV